MVLSKKMIKLRQAVADYLLSEGCSCCQGSNHDEHLTVLAIILEIPKYSDGLGYDFTKFRSTPNN